jgi:phenylalanyl-tRNA synthetase alpha chain
MANEVFNRVAALISEIENATAETPAAVEAFRIRYLGSKNILKPLMGEMRNIPNEQKRDFGQLVNRAKEVAQEKFGVLQAATQDNTGAAAGTNFDLTAPSEPMLLGARHPIALTMRRIISIFERIGFTVAEGPEVEDDWHNFTAMNTPEDHPARDMQVCCCGHIPAPSKLVPWKPPSHQSASSPPAVFTATKPSVLVATPSSTRSKGFTSPKSAASQI